MMVVYAVRHSLVQAAKFSEVEVCTHVSRRHGVLFAVADHNNKHHEVQLSPCLSACS